MICLCLITQTGGLVNKIAPVIQATVPRVAQRAGTEATAGSLFPLGGRL